MSSFGSPPVKCMKKCMHKLRERKGYRHYPDCRGSVLRFCSQILGVYKKMSGMCNGIKVRLHIAKHKKGVFRLAAMLTRRYLYDT